MNLIKKVLPKFLRISNFDGPDDGERGPVLAHLALDFLICELAVAEAPVVSACFVIAAGPEDQVEGGIDVAQIFGQQLVQNANLALHLTYPSCLEDLEMIPMDRNWVDGKGGGAR